MTDTDRSEPSKASSIVQRLTYGVAVAILLGAVAIAIWRVHGFLIGCGQDESPFGPKGPPTCLDPLGYNNHLTFRFLVVAVGLVLAGSILMLGRFAARKFSRA
jgi:hypothetical protein